VIGLIGVAPCFDDVTQISHRWLRELVKYLDENALFPSEKWILLEKEDAIREKVERAIEENPEGIVVFYDHGEESGLVQQGGKEYVIDLKNAGKFKGKVIYTMACLAGKKLGIEHWKNGGVFWGYKEVFGFTTQEEHLFMECANAGLICRIKGKTWEECFEHAKQKFNEAIGKAKLTWSKIWLMWDRDCLVLYSDKLPPEVCMLRRLALRLFGRRGWKIRWVHILFLIGWGITLHAVASELYYKGGYSEILRPQGEYIGLALMMISFLWRR